MSDVAEEEHKCHACGAISARWSARCSECQEWSRPSAGSPTPISKNALRITPRSEPVERLRSASPIEPRAGNDPEVTGSEEKPPPTSIAVSTTDVDVSAKETRIVTGIEPLDRVLGGGLVIGSMVLLGGTPGTGKSTILMQMMAAIAQDGIGLYATGEESVTQVAIRAHRVNAARPNIKLVRETDLDNILWHARREQARVVVVDSMHTVSSSAVSGIPGSDYQVKACGQFLMRFAKDSGTCVVVISHVNKDGEISGPMNFEHAGDVTLMMTLSELGEPWRELRAIKNRFGPTIPIGMFQMADGGLLPVDQDAVPRRDDAPRDELLPVAQELLHRFLEIGGELDADLRDRIAGRLDATPRGAP